MKRSTMLLAFLTGLLAAPLMAAAQTVKVGIVNTYSGPGASLGENIDKGIRLYLKLNERRLPPGVKIELLRRDDGGANPQRAMQLAQELVASDKVHILAGVVWTPNAAAIAQVATEAKVPFIVMNAAGSNITTLSPYVVRVSMTLWQSAYPTGVWAARKYKRAYIAVSDFSPGHDSETAFEKGFREGGGQIVGKVRFPLADPDFMPLMQRAKQAKPDVLFSFIPAGPQSTRIMKAYGDLGMKKAGIDFIGPGDITPDDELRNMGDVALGIYSVHHYSAAATRAANKAFIVAWKRQYGENSVPSFMAVGGYDGMDAVFHIVREQKGKIDPERSMLLLRGYKNPNSPRGPIYIDPATRDIVQNQYLREVRKVNGKLANVEVETVATAVKDPWKALNKK